ncbi:glycoside hydrolase family 3 protein [Lentithecium fluviatile CBS 122367]|uniref:beta-glucosidase n=1 Tax=Lentithecium fluviatile CBS 122367 TaxID=1168545 RepID=A0A6G1ICC7_9PLEO|nr:glycoside hydrolase family 3 protein [Lentithecium fluviatile CBS 122367]
MSFSGNPRRKRNAFVSLFFATSFIPSVSCLPDHSRTASPHSIAKRSTNETLPYQDASLCIDERVEDLLQRMTLEEKAGQLFHTQIQIGPNGTLDTGNVTARRNSTENMVGEKHMTHFNLLGDVEDVRTNAEWYNRLQERALSTRLGIPITLSSDPRHAFTENIGTGFAANQFSQWPESLGLAALRDPELVQKFAEIAREEYMAIGIRSALHPQIDLTTEPRWARIANTMGEDANLTSQLVVAYLKGFQGEEIGAHSVTTVTKHFPGGGPMENGEDSHFTYGKNATYPGHNFEYHLIPFKAAIAAGARQMMPYYSRPIGTEYDEVGFSFNKGIITDLLRGELGFDGIVCSDWGLITDTVIRGQDMPARAWGVEYLSELKRAARILQAGVDQFGGEQRPELIVELVNTGVITEERLDTSIRRLLREKFVLGLFENPFVDVDAAVQTVGNPYFRRLGNETQRKAYTLLTNNNDILPLKNTANMTFYVEGIDPSYLEARDLHITTTPSEATLALVRLQAPYEPRPGGFEAAYHAGSLEYNATEKARQAAIYSAVPSIVDIYLDRPAAIPEIAESAAALLANFGAGPDAFLDVVFGVGGTEPMGKLPFDLPRSMEAVEASLEDVPFDTLDPVFRFGNGLRYKETC